MDCQALVLTGAGISAVSGFPAAMLSPRASFGQQLAAMMNFSGCAIGLAGVAQFYSDGPVRPLSLPSPIDGFNFTVAMDGLSAFFLIPLLLVCGLASIYGLQYWPQIENASNGRRVSLFLGLLTGAMAVLVVAGDGLLFLFAWETMALSAFFLVGAEDHLAESRKAAWLYIAASHLATLCIFGVFAILYSINGSFEYATLSDSSSAAAGCLAVLAFVGFGTKAGIMPMHVWLPSAHAEAPSHVSAVMSGVIIKMGIYGIVRVAAFFSEIPLSWGVATLAAGTVSAVLGVAFAVGQHDIKRLLAYHSIENIGIIVMGIGLALIGRATARPELVVLGMCGGLLHVWNHALFKSLLFLGAGSVIHSMGTRDIDVMGGLSRRMPATAICFLIGATAICGLPPLNGFVSELLIYLGLFRTLTAEAGSFATAAAFAAPALALVGALAVACFVKLYGVVFLGVARSEKAHQAHESGPAMTGPMFLLASCCILIGIAPALFVPVLDQAVAACSPMEIARQSVGTLAPLVPLSIIAGLLMGMTAVGTLVLLRRMRTSPASVTWDCGYANPTARMQYSSSSFAQWLVDLFTWALRPHVHRPQIETLFPAEDSFDSHVNDTVLEEVVQPGVRFFAWLFGWSRYLQSGSLQAYLFYILAIVVGLLLWSPGE